MGRVSELKDLMIGAALILLIAICFRIGIAVQCYRCRKIERESFKRWQVKERENKNGD